MPLIQSKASLAQRASAKCSSLLAAPAARPPGHSLRECSLLSFVGFSSKAFIRIAGRGARHSRERGNPVPCSPLSDSQAELSFALRGAGLVIPAKAGIQFLAFLCRIFKQSFHSPSASESLSLARARESNQREARPWHCAFRAPARKVRISGLCSAECTSVCTQRNRRDPSRRPCGHRGRCRRNAKGNPRAARILRARAEQGSPGMDGISNDLFGVVRGARASQASAKERLSAHGDAVSQDRRKVCFGSNHEGGRVKAPLLRKSARKIQSVLRRPIAIVVKLPGGIRRHRVLPSGGREHDRPRCLHFRKSPVVVPSELVARDFA